MYRSIFFQAALFASLCSWIATADGGYPKRPPCRTSGTAHWIDVAPPVRIDPPAHRVIARSPAPPVVQRPATTLSPPAQPTPQVGTPEPVTPTLADRISAAVHAFRLGNNHEAKVRLDELLQTAPESADLLQLRALVHLRAGDLKRSAFDAYEAVKHGTIWNAEQVEKVYGDATRYHNDVRVLRLLAESPDQDLAAHFLSAYHHLVAGELELGRKSLQQVLELQPDEPVAVALIQLIETQATNPPATQVAKTVD